MTIMGFAPGNALSPVAISAGGQLGNADDVAFAILALRLQSLDSDINQRIVRSQQQIALREKYMERINELRSAINASGATGEDDSVHIPDANGDGQNERMYKVDYYVDASGEVKQKTLAAGEEDRFIGGTHRRSASKSQVDREIERLQTVVDQLNGRSELEMMQLQRLVSSRQTALQETSQILSSSHQTRMGIINNIGK